ncbi:MAG TPA: tetratricopeptide repeat protein [Verrucomicrobiae bacterium]
MKLQFFPLLVAVLICLGTSGARAIDADLGRFSLAKQQQIRAFAETITNRVPPIVWRFFDAVRVDDWETATNLANRINQASHRYVEATNDETMTPALATLLWPPISESYGAYGEFHDWNNRWLHRFGREIIDSIPPGSIYFGGTDPGRFIISALSDSQVTGQPFFTLTQNQLVDQNYLDYLGAMYGKKIRVPASEDLRKAFDDYAADAAGRQKLGLLKPGEEVRTVNGRVEVTGQVAVMQVNSLLARKIFEDNTGPEFFIEESFPLEWMYPYLTPHGLVFKLNHQSLTAIPDKVLAADRDYWRKLTGEMLGPWLDDKATIRDVCDFAEKYGNGKRLEGFPGDKAFAENGPARKCFSKLRTSAAGLYAWRAEHAKSADERSCMYQAADFAFRQGYAICPQSPEAIYRYINLLISRKHLDEAILIAKTSLHLDPDNQQYQGLLSQLVRYQKESR